MEHSVENALYSVATPIGNLGDITLRAIEVLKNADVIAAEDTRTTSVLLEKYSISTRLISYHKFSENQRTELILNYLKEGKSVALVTDAGTPLISDPGNILIEAAIKEGFRVVPVVGASAVIALLSATSRLDEDFKFIGFISRAKGEIEKTILNNLRENLVFYESPQRILDTLELIKNIAPNKKISIGRELTKKFEENNIPISLFILNKWDNSNYEFSDFYKNPQSVIDYLHTKNIKFGLTIDSPKYFKHNSIVFNKLKDYLPIDKNNNIPFNVFDPKTIDAYLKILIHPLNNMKVDFYSIDTFNENDIERLSILKYYLYYDKLSNKENRSMISSHNFTYAAHRYPILYSGKSNVSWDTLKKIPAFNSSASNIGLSFWSHDAGGSSDGIEDNELFNRFIQLATFSPILRLGSDSGKYYKREPWKWGLKTKEISTRFLNLRHKLIPYLYTESYKYFKYGRPLIEPIYYKIPMLYDDNLYKDEYFFRKFQ